MGSRVELPPKFAGETVNLPFDFTSQLAIGETISTKVCTAATYSGTDASPSSVISGAASSSGAVVTQAFTAGTVGVIYEITCTITTSASQTLIITGYLVIIPKTP